MCVADGGSSVTAIGAGAGVTAVTHHILIQLLVLLRERHMHIDHLEMPEALQALDHLASDALDAFGVFHRKWGVTIGDGECLLVETAKMGEARELGCDHVRKSEHCGSGNWMDRVRQCLVASSSRFSMRWVALLTVARYPGRRAR